MDAEQWLRRQADREDDEYLRREREAYRLRPRTPSQQPFELDTLRRKEDDHALRLIRQAGV